MTNINRVIGWNSLEVLSAPWSGAVTDCHLLAAAATESTFADGPLNVWGWESSAVIGAQMVSCPYGFFISASWTAFSTSASVVSSNPSIISPHPSHPSSSTSLTNNLVASIHSTYVDIVVAKKGAGCQFIEGSHTEWWRCEVECFSWKTEKWGVAKRGKKGVNLQRPKPSIAFHTAIFAVLWTSSNI